MEVEKRVRMQMQYDAWGSSAPHKGPMGVFVGEEKEKKKGAKKGWKKMNNRSSIDSEFFVPLHMNFCRKRTLTLCTTATEN